VTTTGAGALVLMLAGQAISAGFRLEQHSCALAGATDRKTANAHNHNSDVTRVLMSPPARQPRKTLHNTEGGTSASFMIVDPDGNTIPLDQRV
jgi:hypothetical protein